MKKIDIKVENSSKYWTDFEGELSVYYHLKWIDDNAKIKFINNEANFIKKYVSLSYKYGLVIPLNYDEQNLPIEYQEYKLNNEAKGVSGSNLMYFMYKYNTNLVYPSKLFTSINDKAPKTIINIDPYTELEEIEKVYLHYGGMPFRVELLKKETEIKILCYLDNDIFNLSLENKKCRDFEYPIDNSDLAYLNTPRLNSFLRELKKLCFEFGANEFEFENLGLIDYSENGVLFSKEIIYYEDIYDMLPEDHKYKPFEEIKLDIDSTNYLRYIELRKSK